ncbi:MAG: hypothetical protein JO314_09745 [Acidobacteria bacterium]|nr:hypothetical protein [Acidobacteriota bacterium]
MKRMVLATLGILVLTGLSYGDIRLPDPKPTPQPKQEKTIDATLDIRLDREAKEAKLLIPRSQIKELRAALEQLDNGGDSTAAITSTGFSRAQTIVSGLFMSLAIVFGGIWFARSGKMASKGVKAAVIAVGIGSIATAATFVYGNAGPPAEARSITGKMFSQAVHIYGFGWGKVKLGVSDDENIKLIVPDPKDDKPSGEE